MGTLKFTDWVLAQGIYHAGKGRIQTWRSFLGGEDRRQQLICQNVQWPCVNYTHLFIFHLLNKYFLNTCWDLGQSTKEGFPCIVPAVQMLTNPSLPCVLSTSLSTFFPSFLLSFSPHPSIHPWLCSKGRRRRLKGLCPWLWGQVELDWSYLNTNSIAKWSLMSYLTFLSCSFSVRQGKLWQLCHGTQDNYMICTNTPRTVPGTY